MNRHHPRLRELRFTLYRIFRNPSAIIGFTLLFFFAGVALFAPQIAPPKYAYNPYMMPHKGYSPTPKPPSSTHIFGTTSGQYDIFYGAVWGTRTAFKIGLFVTRTWMTLRRWAACRVSSLNNCFGKPVGRKLCRSRTAP